MNSLSIATLFVISSAFAIADHNINWPKLHTDLDSSCGSNNTAVCVGHQMLSAMEKVVTGGTGGNLGNVSCTCDLYASIRCAVQKEGSFKKTNEVNIGSTSNCNLVRPNAEKKGLVCDIYGVIYRLNLSVPTFEEGENLGSFANCLKQITS